MRRADNLDYYGSLLRAMEGSDPKEIESTARRQERTVDALLNRLYHPDPESRREMVLLADEVGLGKTFVALGVAWSVLAQREAEGLPARPVLIVTPSADALYRKWQREAETFLKDVVGIDPTSKIVPVETPSGLVKALRSRQSRMVIARMSAFSGRLYSYDAKLAAVLHVLFRKLQPTLSVDQRLQLVADWPYMRTREAVSLKSSTRYFSAACDKKCLGFGESQIRAAMRRLKRSDDGLLQRLQQSFDQIARGDKKRSGFWDDLKELARASLGQRIKGEVPLVVVDEIHNWKNHPQSWHRFLHTLGGRSERMLGLSATPFQLGPHELSQVLSLHRCLELDDGRANALEGYAGELKADMDCAHDAGKRLRQAWIAVTEKDLPELHSAWSARRSDSPSTCALPPHLSGVLEAVKALESAHQKLSGSLRPFLVRHRRAVSLRRWWVGRNADQTESQKSMQGSSLKWQPGLDVRGDAELLHYLMMRVVQEQKNGQGTTDLGADLGGSYDFFRENRLLPMQKDCLPSVRPYLELVDQATRSDDGHEHPKVKVTASRVYEAWLHGDKSLVFCFNLKTVDAIDAAVRRRIEDYEARTLSKAFGCNLEEYPKRLENFRKRLYSYQQSVFLLFQDHPFAGPESRLPAALAIQPKDLKHIAQRLAHSGLPLDRSRFDRRRVLAAAEQTLVARWQTDPEGKEWLHYVLRAWMGDGQEESAKDWILAPDWPVRRPSLVEGGQREGEIVAFPDDDELKRISDGSHSKEVAAWENVLFSHAGQAVLATYSSQTDAAQPSLLARWHANNLHGLPQSRRVLATRMLRRMVRSPGFLARFLLDDPASGPALARDGDESDSQWTTVMHQRWSTPPTGGESAKDRFNAYLESLQKVVGIDENFAAYEDASRNQKPVARITGNSDSKERDRYFVGFNTPLVPEVLIVTSVGQEGIDLHRECRHVIHHDLPWNPALLEQRTGRVDRIGSKAARMSMSDPSQGHLDVVVPYIANTYDEHRFRVVHGRSRLFEVTMGGDYAVDGQNRTGDVMEHDSVIDDIDTDDGAKRVVPLPAEIADALRIHLEAEESHE